VTIIAWDGRVMAADKRTTDAGMPWTTTKIVRDGGGALLGACGNSSMCRELRLWWQKGATPENYPDKAKACCLMVVTPDRQILLYIDGPIPVEIHNGFAAIGSGRDYAIAAMHYGRGAIEAVELASIYDTGCGNGVDALTLEACNHSNQPPPGGFCISRSRNGI
jgi:hypothetical protein